MKKLLELIENEIRKMERKASLQECLEVLDDVAKIDSYDFSKVFEMLEGEGLMVHKNSLMEMKQVIKIQSILGFDIIFSKSQLAALNELKSQIKELLEKEGESFLTNYGIGIHDLEDLKNLLIGKIKKDCDYEKIITFLLIANREKISLDDAILMSQMNIGMEESLKPEWEDVVALFQEFFEDDFASGKEKSDFSQALDDNKEEILHYIRLDNTREILEFFKRQDVLSRFDKRALLKICVFADSEYVKKIFQMHSERDFYYTDVAATLWICDSNSKRNVIGRKKGSFSEGREKVSPSEGREKGLYAQCHSAVDEEFWQNVALLSENSLMFSDKYRNTIANLKECLSRKENERTLEEKEVLKPLLPLLMKNPELVRKNISLFHQFELKDIPVSSLEFGDVEDKIHLAVELGLLHSPVNYAIDGEIYTNDAFHEKYSDDNDIKDYFSRYPTVISSLDLGEYAFYKYALNNLGYVTFYNYFFSDKRIGKRNQINFLEDITKLFGPGNIENIKESMKRKEDFIREHFVSISESIPNYSIYNQNIVDYQENSYYDESIVDKDFVKRLDQDYLVNDYVYQIGNTFISRYKVLHNITAILRKHDNLSFDALMVAVARNSFLSEEEFSRIQEEMKKMLESNKSYGMVIN